MKADAVVEHVEMYALAEEQKRRHGFLCQSLLSSEEDAFKELYEVVFIVKRLIVVHNLNGFFTALCNKCVFF